MTKDEKIKELLRMCESLLDIATRESKFIREIGLAGDNGAYRACDELLKALLDFWQERLELLREPQEKVKEKLAPIVIETEQELNDIIKAAENLAFKDDLSIEEQSALKAMYAAIGAYENEHYQIDTSDITPLDTLLFLMEERNMSASDLSKMLEERTFDSEIFQKEPFVSREHILRLARIFHVSPSLFGGKDD